MFSAVALAGCNGSSANVELRRQVADLQQQTDQLQSDLQSCRQENSGLQQRMATLAQAREDANLASLYNLTGIKIGRFTGLYDKDDDGEIESLIVYIQPMDDTGDIIKAPGSVQVELWNLNNAENSLISQWNIEPEKLKELWFSTVLTINYRLTFDISNKLDEFSQPLTVKVRFVDYMTGKTFNEQTLIKP
jgi:outer membrane murein-binding lipoprotein Lpp